MDFSFWKTKRENRGDGSECSVQQVWSNWLFVRNVKNSMIEVVILGFAHMLRITLVDI